MSVELSLHASSEAPEERDVLCNGGKIVLLRNLRRFRGLPSYRHLAALRLGHETFISRFSAHGIGLLKVQEIF